MRSRYLLGICLLILFYTTLSTFLYFQQAQIIRDSFADPAQRTTVFAAMDFATNALTLVIQIFFTGRIVQALGLGWSLALVPLLLGAGFFILGMAPVLAVLVTLQVVHLAFPPQAWTTSVSLSMRALSSFVPLSTVISF